MPSLAARAALVPPERVAAAHDEAVADWERPFSLKPDEQAVFDAHLAPALSGAVPGVLVPRGMPHSLQVSLLVFLCCVSLVCVMCCPSLPPSPSHPQHTHTRTHPPHNNNQPKALDAARPAVLARFNAGLDAQLAALGVHPAAESMSDAELVAAMQLLE